MDGANLVRVGSFALNNPAAVCPDAASHRVYFLDWQNLGLGSTYSIKAFEPDTFALMRRLTLPAEITSTAPYTTFIRWGQDGLAFRRNDSVVLINSSQLVPNDPPTDLSVTVRAAPVPAWVGGQLAYTVEVTNRGPNVARDTIMAASISASQSILGTVVSKGSVVTSGSAITFRPGDLAVGESVTLVINTAPTSAGLVSCTAIVNCLSIDPNLDNNTGRASLSAGFQSTIDSVQRVRLSANNLVYDRTRNLLWATLYTSSVAPPGGNGFPDRSLVAIDPTNGLTSDPVPLAGNTIGQSIAISPNGRYLYVGLSTGPVQRFDLSTTPPTSLVIPLGNNPAGQTILAQDIEVLDGDGTSFLMAGLSDHAAVVFDGSVPRPIRTAAYKVSRIERTATPGLFIGYNNYTFPTATFALSQLSVTSSGVSIIASSSDLVRTYQAEFRASGGLLLSSSGTLLESSTFRLLANLPFTGAPCLDAENGRAYLLDNSLLRAFDTSTGNPTGTFYIASGSTCVRWGFDGFAVAGYDDLLHIARWSAASNPRQASPRKRK